MKLQAKQIMKTIMFLAILSGIASARMPEIGDYVSMQLGTKENPVSIEGTITDIGNGLICLNSTWATADAITIWDDTNPRDICIGTGSIIFLQWHD